MQASHDQHCTKVLHVIMSPSIGGIEKLVINLARHHAGDPQVETGIFFIQPFRGELTEAFSQLNIPLLSVGLNSGYDLNPLKLLRAWKIFRQYDVIHIHCFNVFVAMTAVLARRKIIYTEHGNFVLGREPRLADKLNRRFLRIFLNNHAGFVTFNSQHTKAGATKLFGLEKVNSAVVDNGVPIYDVPEKGEGVDPAVLKQLEHKFVVGTSSRFAAFKRIDRLIEAFSEFIPGKDAVLLLVGNGPLYDRFVEMVEHFNMTDSVIFTGFQTNVRAYQNMMDVCVFPSESEPFGLVSIEAYSLESRLSYSMTAAGW